MVPIALDDARFRPWLEACLDVDFLKAKRPKRTSTASRVVDAHGNIHDEATGQFTAKAGGVHSADLQAAIEGWVYGGRTGCGAIRDSIASGTPTAEAQALLDALSRENADAPVLYRGIALKDGGAEALCVPGSEIDLNLSSFSSSREYSDSFLDVGTNAPPTAQAVRFVLSGASQALDLVKHGPVVVLPEGVTGEPMMVHEREWVTGGRFHVDYVRQVPDPWGPDRPDGYGNDYTIPTWEVGLTQVAVIR